MERDERRLRRTTIVLEIAKNENLEEGSTGTLCKPCQDHVHKHILVDGNLEFPPSSDMWHDDVEDGRDVSL